MSGVASITEKKLRLFIALPVPAAIRDEFARVQAKLRQHLPDDDIRWSRLEQTHLTLLFLGNVASNRVESLTEALRDACTRFAPLQLRAERLGFFPHAQSPRVLWVWVHDDTGELIRLQRAVSAACASFGSAEETGSFTGHLTLGRARKLRLAKARVLADLAREMEDGVLGDWQTPTVELMRSELGQGGSRHSCIAAIPLSKPK